MRNDVGVDYDRNSVSVEYEHLERSSLSRVLA
jgi:hypothetical protein